jgi:hypothetical protein
MRVPPLLVLPALAVLTLAAVPVTAYFAPAGAVTAVSPCTIAQVGVTVAAAPPPARMRDGRSIEIANVSHADCVLHGYARLEFFDAAHRRLRVAGAGGSTFFHVDPGATTVRLQRGSFATSTASWLTANGSTYENRTCVETAYVGVRVADGEPLIVRPLNSRICGVAQPGALPGYAATAYIPGPAETAQRKPADIPVHARRGIVGML